MRVSKMWQPEDNDDALQSLLTTTEDDEWGLRAAPLEELEEEEKGLKHEAIRGGYDLCRAYFKNMSLLPLISKDEERELGKRREEGEREVRNALFSRKIVVEEMMSLAEQLERGEEKIGDVINNIDKGPGTQHYLDSWASIREIRRIGRENKKIEELFLTGKNLSPRKKRRLIAEAVKGGDKLRRILEGIDFRNDFIQKLIAKLKGY